MPRSFLRSVTVSKPTQKVWSTSKGRNHGTPAPSLDFSPPVDGSSLGEFPDQSPENVASEDESSRYYDDMYESDTKSLRKDYLKDITGRMAQLLSDYEETYRLEDVEDYIGDLGEQAAQLDNNELKHNIKRLMQDYNTMCLEREEILLSLDDWFGSVEELDVGIGSTSLRDSIEEGKKVSERLQDVKGQITKLASYGDSVQHLIAEKKKLEKELLKAKVNAEKVQAVGNKELKEAVEGTREKNNVWKYAASEVCKLLSKVRDSGDSEIAGLIGEMDEMIKTLDERSTIIEKLRLDIKRLGIEVKQYKEKVGKYKIVQERHAMEKEMWSSQLKAFKEKLLESERLHEEAQASREQALLELKERQEKHSKELVTRSQNNNFRRQPTAGRLAKLRRQKTMEGAGDVEEEDAIEDELFEVEEESNVVAELQTQVETLEKDNIHLKKKLDYKEREVTALQSQIDELEEQQQTTLAALARAAEEKEVMIQRYEQKELEITQHLPVEEDVEMEQEASDTDEVCETVASPEVARPELVDQAVQTDFPEPKISKPVVVEMRENEVLEESIEKIESKPFCHDQHLPTSESSYSEHVTPMMSSSSIKETDVLPDSFVAVDSQQHASSSDDSRSGDPLPLPCLCPAQIDLSTFSQDILDDSKREASDITLATMSTVFSSETLKPSSSSDKAVTAARADATGEVDIEIDEVDNASSAQEYVYNMVSRIGDVITTFVDKASCLVETESFNVVEAVESKGRHVDEQGVVYWTSQINLAKTEAPESPTESELDQEIHPSDYESPLCSLVIDTLEGEWWQNVSVSRALSGIGTHCVNVLKLCNELFVDRMMKQKEIDEARSARRDMTQQLRIQQARLRTVDKGNRHVSRSDSTESIDSKAEFSKRQFYSEKGHGRGTRARVVHAGDTDRHLLYRSSVFDGTFDREPRQSIQLQEFVFEPKYPYLQQISHGSSAGIILPPSGRRSHSATPLPTTSGEEMEPLLQQVTLSLSAPKVQQTNNRRDSLMIGSRHVNISAFRPSRPPVGTSAWSSDRSRFGKRRHRHPTGGAQAARLSSFISVVKVEDDEGKQHGVMNDSKGQVHSQTFGSETEPVSRSRRRFLAAAQAVSSRSGGQSRFAAQNRKRGVDELKKGLTPGLGTPFVSVLKVESDRDSDTETEMEKEKGRRNTVKVDLNGQTSVAFPEMNLPHARQRRPAVTLSPWPGQHSTRPQGKGGTTEEKDVASGHIMVPSNSIFTRERETDKRALLKGGNKNAMLNDLAAMKFQRRQSALSDLNWLERRPLFTTATTNMFSGHVTSSLSVVKEDGERSRQSNNKQMLNVSRQFSNQPAATQPSQPRGAELPQVRTVTAPQPRGFQFHISSTPVLKSTAESSDSRRDRRTVRVKPLMNPKPMSLRQRRLNKKKLLGQAANTLVSVDRDINDFVNAIGLGITVADLASNIDSYKREDEDFVHMPRTAKPPPPIINFVRQAVAPVLPTDRSSELSQAKASSETI